MSETRIYRTREVLDDLNSHIERKEPFSLIRFGDGGLKLIDSVLAGDTTRLTNMSKKEGIPLERFLFVIDMWGRYGTQANYVDSPDIYFREDFWSRHKLIDLSDYAKGLIKEWRKFYRIVGINNSNFCNPEISFLSILMKKSVNEINLFDIIYGRRICCITSFPDSTRKLTTVCSSVKTIPIVRKYGGQFVINFERTMSLIERTAQKYDLWLIGAGELGRLYTGAIKKNGGRSFDIGTVFDFWASGFIPLRLVKFIRENPKNLLEIALKSAGRKYREFL